MMAERGPQTMLFGPLKPVGLKDPRTHERPHAVVQLRPENRYESCYNMVGFQTKLTYPFPLPPLAVVSPVENHAFGV